MHNFISNFPVLRFILENLFLFLFVKSKPCINKAILRTPIRTSFSPFAFPCMSVHHCMCACACVSSCKMRGGRTFPFCCTVSSLPHSHRNHWLQQDRLFMNFELILLAFMNQRQSLPQVVQASATVDSLEGLPCKVAYRVEQCKGRVDKHMLCLIRPKTDFT